MDGGAWWAAVYGVAQSWTRLKLLSSSSSPLNYTPLLCFIKGPSLLFIYSESLFIYYLSPPTRL